jgi:hypothetical protein
MAAAHVGMKIRIGPLGTIPILTQSRISFCVEGFGRPPLLAVLITRLSRIFTARFQNEVSTEVVPAT